MVGGEKQVSRRTGNWWPLAAVGLALIAVLATGCSKCKQCRPGGGPGAGPDGPRPGGPCGPRRPGGPLDGDGLQERLEDELLSNDRARPPMRNPQDPGLPEGVPPDAFPVPSGLVPQRRAAAADSRGVVSRRGVAAPRLEADVPFERL